MSPSPEVEAIQTESRRDDRTVDFDELVEKARKAELKALKKAEKEMQRANADTAEREARKLDEAEGTGETKKGGKLRFEGELERAEAAAYLEAIVRGLRSGSIQFRREDETLALTPGERVCVSVKAASKKGRESVSFELEWREPSPDESALSIVAD